MAVVPLAEADLVACELVEVGEVIVVMRSVVKVFVSEPVADDDAATAEEEAAADVMDIVEEVV